MRGGVHGRAGLTTFSELLPREKGWEGRGEGAGGVQHISALLRVSVEKGKIIRYTIYVYALYGPLVIADRAAVRYGRTGAGREI